MLPCKYGRLQAGSMLAATFLAWVGPDYRAVAQDKPATESPQAQEEQTFEVAELRILGNTQLREIDIDRVIYRFLGPKRTLKDIEAAREALENFYHARGFGTVFVDIPEQSVDSGIVRLKVTEGRIRKVAVTGARYFSGREIRTALPSANPGDVPHLPTLQNELSAVNSETPDRVVTPILKAGSAPGTVDLNLRVDDHLPLHASLEVNNQYTTDTEPLRVIGSLSYDNLFRRLDSISVLYQTSPQDRDQVDVLTANYVMRFDTFRAALYTLHSDSNVSSISTGTTAAEGGTGGGASQVLILGKGDVYGARFIVPLMNDADGTHNLTFGAEYKNFFSSIDSQPIQQDPNAPPEPHSPLDTPLTYWNFSAGYGGFWRERLVQASFDVTANFGIRGLRDNAADFENKRFRARPNYLYLRSQASIGTHFPGDISLVLRAAGQYANEPIISNEQFAIAGADGVRGYLEAEELADTGIKGSLQLGTPQWKPFGGRFKADAFVFYDYGRIGVIDSLPGEISTRALRSYGGGLNLGLMDHVAGVLTWARALDSAPATPSGNFTESGDSRFLFSVRTWW